MIIVDSTIQMVIPYKSLQTFIKNIIVKHTINNEVYKHYVLEKYIDCLNLLFIPHLTFDWKISIEESNSDIIINFLECDYEMYHQIKNKNTMLLIDNAQYIVDGTGFYLKGKELFDIMKCCFRNGKFEVHDIDEIRWNVRSV